MPTLKYLDEVFDCATAIKGDDYIHLLDDNGIMVAAFDAITDFSAFALENGSYVSPTADHSCKVAVIRDDGTIGVGGHTCEDIGNAVPKTRKVNGKPLSADIAITGDDIEGIYSKDAVLKDQTKTLYGLNVSALPDDVFNKLKDLVGSAANTVKDTAQNKAVTISSAFHSFSTKDIQSPLASGSVGTNGNGFPASYMRGSILYAFCNTYNSTSRSYTLYLVAYNVETNAVVSSQKLYESLGSSDASANSNYFCAFNCASHDDSVVSCYITGYPAILDLQHNLLYSGMGSSVRCAFSTPNYWGYVYVDSYKSRYMYYAPRGSTSFKSVNLGNGSSSSYYDIGVCGTYGDNLVYTDRTWYADFKTGRVNLATGTVTSGIETCSITNKFGSTSWGGVDVMLGTSTHAYLNVWFNFNNDDKDYMPNKTIKVDLATGLTNFAEVTSKIVCPAEDPSYMYYYSYIGSVGTKAYYAESNYSNRVMIYDRATDSYSQYTLETTTSNLQTRKSVKEAQFDIKGMPGTIPCGQNFFDTNKGCFNVYAVDARRTVVSNVGVQDVSSSLTYPAFQCGGLTELKCLGFMKSDMTRLAVPPIRRAVQFVEEFK